MRIKLVNVLMGAFVSVVFGFSVCSGADKITPVGTPVNIAPLTGVLTGAATGANLSIPSLIGSNDLYPSIEITGSAKVIAHGETTLDDKIVTKASTLIDLAGNNTFALAKDEYFQKDTIGDIRLVKIVKNGHPIVPTEAFPLPSSGVKVGDSGKIATFIGNGTIESTWEVKGSINNESIFQVITTIKKDGTLLATEVTSFYLNAAGMPKDFVWLIEAADGKKGTLSGKIKTEQLGAGATTRNKDINSKGKEVAVIGRLQKN